MTPLTNQDKEDLQGSVSHDIFKQRHKKNMRPEFYSSDIDLMAVTKFPHGIAAIIDYKKPADHLTFSEVVAYNDLIKKGYSVYIISSDDPSHGPFDVYLDKGGNPDPEPPVPDLKFRCHCANWDELEQWENVVRIMYKEFHG